MKRTLLPVGRAIALIGVFAAIGASSVAQQRQQRRPARPLPNPSPEAVQEEAVSAKERSVSKPAKFDRIVEKLKVTEPKSHENLTVFLIEGDDRMDTTKVLTLSEALQKKGTCDRQGDGGRQRTHRPEQRFQTHGLHHGRRHRQRRQAGSNSRDGSARS
jgi:hypothetical protein